MGFNLALKGLKEIILRSEIMDKFGCECKKLVIESRNISV
jgi:hypothetical protein